MEYKNNKDFIETLVSVGKLLNSLDKAVHKLSKYLVEYFPEREHYETDDAREFMTKERETEAAVEEPSSKT